MLGCQDFCGYYDWTFHYVRRTHGQAAVHALWRDAIGGESQRHYTDAARQNGLRGLLQVWNQTGHDEHCDWTFTLDEAANTLRWDMRQCPSKGFLLDHDLAADEDYCDHCMGWIVPMLREVGMEVAAHEHNHFGQCWAEIKVAGKPSTSLALPLDIRQDARWGRGYVDRFSGGVKLPVLQSLASATDPCDVLTQWFGHYAEVRAWSGEAIGTPAVALLATDQQYVSAVSLPRELAGVLIGHTATNLPELGRRFHGTPAAERPLLMHTYLPAEPRIDFGQYDLPRPVPILPWLIRQGVYHHRPGRPAPSIESFLDLLVSSL